MVISFTNDGFTLDGLFVPWSAVVAIVTEKIDLYIHDDIHLAFRTADGGWLHVSEEAVGFKAFAAEIERRYPSIPRDWLSVVMLPPFAPNVRVLWSSVPSPLDAPAHPPALEYDHLPLPSRSGVLLPMFRALRRYVFLGVSLYILGLVTLPIPYGIWYVGKRPQWIIAFEGDLIIGPTYSSVRIAAGWLIAIKLIVLTLPVWTVRRIFGRKVPLSEISR